MTKTELPAEMKLTFVGELGIRRIDELKVELQQAIDQSAALSVDLSQVDKIDLCAVQLFCAAHRTAVDSNCSLRLLEPLPVAMSDLAAEAGLGGRPDCTLRDKRDCLWIRQNEGSL